MEAGVGGKLLFEGHLLKAGLLGVVPEPVKKPRKISRWAEMCRRKLGNCCVCVPVTRLIPVSGPVEVQVKSAQACEDRG